MNITRRRGTIALSITLGAILVGVTIYLNISYIILHEGRVLSLVFGILLFLLSRPLLLAEFEGDRARSVVMLLDKSQSMTLQDRRLTPTDQMRVALAYGKVPPTASLTDSVPDRIVDALLQTAVAL